MRGLRSAQVRSVPTAKEEELRVAKRTIFVSDLSGKEVAEGRGATITVKFADSRKGIYILDVTDDEGEELGQKGRKAARRGRRPKAAAA
jgi:hypothetical protein